MPSTLRGADAEMRAGVVHQHVQLVVVLLELLGETVDGGLVGQVCGEHLHSGVAGHGDDVGAGGLTAGRGPGDERHGRAAAGEICADRPAHAAGRAGDHAHLVRQ